MRTELARVQTEAQKQSFIRNGFEEYEFIANGDCCDVCKGINDKHFVIDAASRSITNNGEKILLM